jgi:hypothetical protein
LNFFLKVNFGDIKIPKNIDYPRPQKIDALNGVHHVSSDPVVVVDAQTLLIPNFSYDGEAPGKSREILSLTIQGTLLLPSILKRSSSNFFFTEYVDAILLSL